MIKIEDHTAENIDDLAAQHYQSIILPTNMDGSHHATQSLIGRIETRRAVDAGNVRRIMFWDYLLNNNCINLQRIITRRPSELKIIIDEIETLVGNTLFSTQLNYEESTLTDFGKIVKSVFNYKLYRSKQDCIDNCNKLNLIYCPYCNEQVIQVVTKLAANGVPDDDIALLQLDHFYPQSRYPYLAVSFFNLIPGCAPCNAQLKLEKNFDIVSHFNPYDKRFDDYFIFNLTDLTINKVDDVSLSINDKVSFPRNAIADFQIIERYKNHGHKRVVFKLLNAIKNHSPKIRQSIDQQFTGLFLNEQESINSLLESQNVPIEVSEINEVQLGKLRRDIAIQLNLII